MGTKGRSSLALYRKYRSRTLDEVLGQDHVTLILKKAIAKGKIAHAYLLTGPRGTGKTSVARILAHEINQLPYDDDSNHLDIIEIDAASNNGVDDIRNLREKARIAPVSAERKIYIIDEVHMLSKPAFNALLKTLEEPPVHVVFILATTDADKLPATILSRVQQYYFHPISVSVITKQLLNIAQQEGFLLEEDAAKLIAERSRGGFRDSISMLDQLSSLASKSEALTSELVSKTLGLADHQLISELLDAYVASETSQMLSILQSLEDQGSHPQIISQQLLSLIRGQLVERPNLVKLMKKLIEVERQPHQELSLIAALLEDAAPTATAAPKKQTKPEKDSPAPEKPTKTVATQVVKNDIAVTDDKIEAPATTQTKAKPKNKSADAPAILDWQQLLEQAKQHSIGLFSLLAKCGHSYDSGELVLYAGTSFKQKMLSDTKNRLILTEVLQKSHGDGLELTILGEKKPPENEKLAAVAAMMGGGEEVNLEEIS